MTAEILTAWLPDACLAAAYLTVTAGWETAQAPVPKALLALYGLQAAAVVACHMPWRGLLGRQLLQVGAQFGRAVPAAPPELPLLPTACDSRKQRKQLRPQLPVHCRRPALLLYPRLPLPALHQDVLLTLLRQCRWRRRWKLHRMVGLKRLEATR